MIERHRNAEPVLLGKMLTAADVIRVQQQVPMAKHRRLRKAGCAGGVLNVDRIAGLKLAT